MKYLLRQLKDNPEISISAKDIFDYNDSNLREIIKIISKIPEMDLKVGAEGSFSPELVAEITKDWVNGKNIKEIADKNICFIIVLLYLVDYLFFYLYLKYLFL